MSEIKKYRVNLSRYFILFVVIFFLFLTKQVNASVLTPGTIYSCGEIATNGTYTLSATSTFTPGAGNDCFVITAGGTSTQTIIDGNGRTITGNINGNGVNNGDPGHNFTIQSLNIIGTTSSNGAPDSGSCSGGGNGGNIILSTSTSVAITANAGNPGFFSCNWSSVHAGNGGHIIINGRDIDLSTTTISAKGGYATGDVDGSVTINYSNTVNVLGMNISALADFTINSPLNTPGSLGVTGGGIIGTLPGGTINSNSQCNLAFAGTYTLGSNISSDCNITADNIILNGAGHTVSGQVNGSSPNSFVKGHSFTIENINVLGTTTSAGIYGTIGDLFVNCYGYGTFYGTIPQLDGGSITVLNSTTTSIVSKGSFIQNYNLHTCGLLGIAGSINITNSKFNYIESNGTWSGGSDGLDNVITITGDILDLSSVLFNNYDGYSGSKVSLNYNSLITNNSTLFSGGGANPLFINGFSIGNFSGVFNPTGLYFNDLVSGAGSDGNWNNPLNWWNDTLFTIPSGGVPNNISNYVVYSSVLNNSGVSPVNANSFTFNNGAVNTIDLNANLVTFNGTSSNMGVIIGVGGQVIFNGNLSENNATSTIFVFNQHGVNTEYSSVISSASGENLITIGDLRNVYTSNNYGNTWNLESTLPSVNYDPGNGLPPISISPYVIHNSLISSSDGTKLSIINDDGQIYTSTNSGLNWNANGVYRRWNSITSSSNGSKLAAVAASNNSRFCIYNSIYCDDVFVSTDSGTTWTYSTSTPSNSTDGTNSGNFIQSSIDGTKLILVNNTGTYISNNFGTSWTLSTSTPGGISQFIATSDGTKLIAFGTGNVFVSTNFGTTWSTTTSPTLPRNATFSASSDGSQLVGVVNNGSLYISSDSGATWTPYGSVKPWTDVTQSADGTKIVGVTGQGIDMPLGSIYTMTNTPTLVHRVGVIASSTPIRQYSTTTDAGTRNFTDQNWIVQISGGVANLSSSTYNTTQDTFQELLGGSFITNPSINGGAALTPQYTISSPTANATTTKWHPSTNWASSTATTCLYSYDNYVTTHTVNCANNGSDIAKPATDGLQTLYLQATDVRGDLKQQSVTFSYDRTSPTFTSCGTDLLDESTRPYYYLNGNVTGDCIVATNNIVLYGNPATTSTTTSYTISGNVIATSTTNGYNVTVNNTTVNGSIIASGANNPSGIGYRGGNVSIDPSITGPVVSNGGNGTSQGGNGGNITILNSAGTQGTSTPVSANGGNATVCGYGGSGGTITITNSLYATPTSNAGTDMTATFAYGGQCPNVYSYSGSSGSSGQINVIGQYTPPANSQNQIQIPNIPVNSPEIQSTQSSNGGSSNINPLPSPDSVGQSSNNSSVTSFIKSVGNAIVSTANSVINVASNVVNTPVSKTVQTTGFFAGILSTLVLYTQTSFATPLAAAEIPFIPIHLWNLALMGLGIRKRTRPWGTVYDSVTKRPIDPAYVTVKDINGKVVAESFTDIDGRYGFFLPDGTYYLSVRKTNYEFPSNKLVGKTSDELYSNLYFGEPVTINGGQVIDKNIPMDQKNFDWNEYQKNQKHSYTFHSHNEKLFALISKYIYNIGLVVSAIASIISPSYYNSIIFVLYVIIFVTIKFGIKKKKLGQILDRETHQPLSYALIKITSGLDRKIILRSSVTDAEGRYYAIIPKGQYYIEIDKKNSDGSYTTVYQSQLVSNDKGFINDSFEI